MGAKRASLFYALDRYAASFQIKKWLDDGKIVIANRYVSANKGHQLGKLSELESRHEFIQWINEIEYGVLGIPVPDLTLFLHMPPHLGQQLVDQKGIRTYTDGKKRDLHEADLDHLRQAEQAYLFCLEHDPAEKWQGIPCNNQDAPKSMELVHEEIYEHVSRIL